MSVFVELSYKSKPVGQIAVSDSGFVFMTDYSRPYLGQQSYRYFDNTNCPIWDKAEVKQEAENE